MAMVVSMKDRLDPVSRKWFDEKMREHEKDQEAMRYFRRILELVDGLLYGDWEDQRDIRDELAHLLGQIQLDEVLLGR